MNENMNVAVEAAQELIDEQSCGKGPVALIVFGAIGLVTTIVGGGYFAWKGINKIWQGKVNKDILKDMGEAYRNADVDEVVEEEIEE